MKFYVYILALIVSYYPTANAGHKNNKDLVVKAALPSVQYECSKNTQNKPRHAVFLVHGFSGGPKTFGDLKFVLCNHLEEAQPDYHIEINTFVYNTGKKGLTTYDFAKALGGEIASRKLIATEKLSLVSHSQGGLI